LQASGGRQPPVCDRRTRASGGPLVLPEQAFSIAKSLRQPKWAWTRRRGDAGVLAKEPSEDLEAFDLALTKPAAEDPDEAELVKLRFFTGLTMPEIARVMKP
jgi:ECF sigma factor